MSSGNFVEMTFLGRELLLVLFLQDLEVEVQESLDFGSIIYLKAIDVVEQLVKSGQEPSI